MTDGYGGDAIEAKGVHVDHHQLLLVPGTDPSDTPMLLDANDGGVAVSYDLGQTFTQTGDTFSQLFKGIGGGGRPMRGLNTAQFYGVDKMNGADRFVAAHRTMAAGFRRKWFRMMNPGVSLQEVMVLKRYGTTISLIG